MLGFDVLDGELSQRDAIADQRVPVGLDRWVAGWFQQELGSVWGVGRNDGEPEIVTDRDVVVLDEAEHVGVERERRALVVYIHACEVVTRPASSSTARC